MPRPDRSVTTRAVEKPGRKTRRVSSAGSAAATSISVRTWLPHGLLGQLARVDTAAIVLDEDVQATADDLQMERDLAGRFLAAPTALVGRLDAVADGVTQRVHERILESLQDESIGFHVQPDDAEFHLFSFGPRQIAHHFAKALEDALRRHGAGQPNVVLELLAQHAQRPGTLPVQAMRLRARRAKRPHLLSNQMQQTTGAGLLGRRGSESAQGISDRFPVTQQIIRFALEPGQLTHSLVLPQSFRQDLFRRLQESVEMFGTDAHGILGECGVRSAECGVRRDALGLPSSSPGSS